MFNQGDIVNIKISFWIKLWVSITTGTWSWIPNEGTIIRWDESLLAYEVAVNVLDTWYVVPGKLEVK